MKNSKMEISISLLSPFIIWNLGLVWVETFIEPISSVVRQNYNLTYDELHQKCVKKGFYKSNEIYNIILKTNEVLNEVSKYIVKEARKNSTDTEVNWSELIDEICLQDPTIRDNSKSVIDKVQECLDEKDQLSEEKKEEVEENLPKIICENVKVLAQSQYTAEEPGKSPENKRK
ncbi:uncharacterized protein LOC117173382 [Belonocnema kinseyi]|uniref:uncharacterized protein LOC117173382 n=1 Tax=Belonocnema kinseyi TaxID=2817044 RepID=UPI00143DAC42|nr:uncharacterized protein LOC117173382 [Belonocnema kinseyi]